MSSRTVSVGSWLASPPPAAAIEITATRVTAVLLSEQGGRPVIAAHATEPLRPDVAAPSLNAPNVVDEKALAGAIDAVMNKVGGRTRRIALVLPDSVAKVSLLRFDKVPSKLQDLEQLIRWQVRKSAPFRIEDAQVAWQPAAAQAGGGREYLVTVARRDIVRSYEHACDAAGLHAGIVDLATFNQINAVLAGAPTPGDWLLVNVASDYVTIAVVRDGDLIFFRNRAAANDAELADLVHQTAMYHEDRLGGGGFARMVLAGASVMGAAEAERLQRTLGDRTGGGVELIDGRKGADLRDRIAAGPELLDQLAACAGVLLRERAGRQAPRAAGVA